MTALAGMLAGEIRPGEFQGMAALDAWTYEDLKADIQENGVEVPIVVNQDYVIVDGHNRFAIAQELGIVDTLPVEVHTYGSVAETQAAAIRLNVNRRQISKEKRNQYVIQMRELMGMTQREVADRLGVSRQRVQQIEADSPEQETSTGESDPLETAKIKAIAGKGKGRGARGTLPIGNTRGLSQPRPTLAGVYAIADVAKDCEGPGTFLWRSPYARTNESGPSQSFAPTSAIADMHPCHRRAPRSRACLQLETPHM